MSFLTAITKSFQQKKNIENLKKQRKRNIITFFKDVKKESKVYSKNINNMFEHKIKNIKI